MSSPGLCRASHQPDQRGSTSSIGALSSQLRAGHSQLTSGQMGGWVVPGLHLRAIPSPGHQKKLTAETEGLQ